jgi:hypothetical protein
MYYECVKQDTFGKLKLGKTYYIKDNWLYNDNKTIKVYHINSYQLKNMFSLREK